MITYTVFDSATGKILRTGTAMSVASAQLQGSTPGTRVEFVGSDPTTEVIDPGTNLPVDRLPMRNAAGSLTTKNKTTITANGVDAVTISNVPVGAICEVFMPPNLGLVQITDQVVNDGVVIITSTVPGLYQIVLRYQNFLDFGVTINAN